VSQWDGEVQRVVKWPFGPEQTAKVAVTLLVHSSQPCVLVLETIRDGLDVLMVMFDWSDEMIHIFCLTRGIKSNDVSFLLAAHHLDTHGETSMTMA
jgi:hypothetical protein